MTLSATTFIIKLLPLYLNMLLGFIAGKKLKTNEQTISKIMFFMINPLIIFNGVSQAKLDLKVLSLPFIVYLIACLICLMASKLYHGPLRNLALFSAGSGATGYFGLPVAMVIFQPQTQALYIMALLGVTLYDNTLGYYMSAKDSCSSAESLKKVLRLPALYAFAFGLLINFTGLELPSFYHEFMGHIRGVYIVLGMMIIGLSIAGLEHFEIDYSFLRFTFLAKFLVWPALILVLIMLDESWLGFYEPPVYQVLLLLSIVPMAVNMVMMASLSNSKPEKVAATVLLSTIFALFYIPFMTTIFMPKFFN